jgi:hypothetical protein
MATKLPEKKKQKKALKLKRSSVTSIFLQNVILESISMQTHIWLEASDYKFQMNDFSHRELKSLGILDPILQLMPI